MDYHVARNNQKLGVFPGADAQARFQSGEILPSDLVWCEGMPAWRPASEVFTGAVPPSAPPPSLPPPPPGPVPASFAGGAFGANPLQPKPANYLVWSIVVTLLCCIPFGIVGIIFATQVDSKYSAGDYAGAQVASDRAKLWCWLGVGSWFLLVLGSIVFSVFLGGLGALGNLPR